jgi:signal transduction histidine kinase
MVKRLLVFLYFFTFSAPAWVQTSSKFNVHQYTTENGMPSNGIKGLQWDETTGFLWIATEAGLVRFNGIDFRIFTKENIPGLTEERMAYVVRSNDGSIYAADEGGNIIVIREARPEQHPMTNIHRTLGFKRMHYLNASGKELRKQVSELIDKTGSSPWNKLLQPKDGSCIIVKADGSCFYLARGATKFTESEITKRFVTQFMIDEQLFFIDNEKRVFAAKNGLSSLDEVKITDAAGSPVLIDWAQNLLYWDNGMKYPVFFSGSKAWLLKYNGSTIRAELICSEVPPYSYIRWVQYSEKDRTLFIGTDSKGIIVISPKRVLSVKRAKADILERNAYYAQVEMPGNNVLTSEGHVLGQSVASTSTLPITGKFSFTVFSSGDTLLLYAQSNTALGYMCLYAYNYRTGKTIIYEKVPIADRFAIAYDGNQTWIGTDRGVGMLQDDSVNYYFNTPPARRYETSPYAMLNISPGVFMVASCSGLFRYNISNSAVDTILRLPGSCIRSLWKYGEYVFIGTYGQGYYIWKDGRIRAMPQDKNKFLAYSHCFVKDDSDYCWISTNRGLFKASLPDIVNSFENNNPNIYYHYFGRNDGMEITEMNGGCAPCALIMKNKTISFPTMDGLLWLNPEQATPLLPNGNIYLDEFKAGTLTINPDSLADYDIPYTANDIQIKLVYSAWCNKENIYLEYQSNNHKWIPVTVGNEPLITINDLPPGKYAITVRKLNGFGINNYSYKTIVFTINTPWHRQWWFYLLCVLGVFGMVALYLKIRTRQYTIRQRKLEQQVAEKTKELQANNEVLEKNNTIKTKLISIISHDIITPLKFLTVAGRNLLEKRQLMDEELQQETIKEITNTSQELQLLSTNILNWIKYQNENRRLTRERFNMHELVDGVLGILNSLAKQKKLRIVNEVDKDAELYQYYEPLKILVYNLLTNAINFSEKGTISVGMELKNKMAIVSVRDEGMGMTQEKIQSLHEDHVVISSANVDNKKGHGLGYLIIKDLMKMMGASLSIQSEKEKGTVVSISIPVNG